MMIEVPTNDIGLTRLVVCDYSGDPIETALAKQGIPFQRLDLPQLVGMGGTAWLVHYTSPRTGGPMTVLAVPHRYQNDDFSEEYFYFDGLRAEVAKSVDWIERYDRCMALAESTQAIR